MANPYNEGYELGLTGHDEADNPYHPNAEREWFKDWSMGYEDGLEEFNDGEGSRAKYEDGDEE